MMELEQTASVSFDPVVDLEVEGGSGAGAEESSLIWRRIQLSKAKLKGITEVAAILAGFSVVATVELQISKGTDQYLLTAFVVVTAGLVSSTMLSIMIATCILPYIDATSKVNTPMKSESDFPHNSLIWYIDLAWVLANTVSIFLFITSFTLLCWIKFPQVPAICITLIMIPVLILLCVFSFIFYWQTLSHQYIISDRKYHELEELNRRLSKHDRRRSVIRTLSNISSPRRGSSSNNHV